MKNNVTYCDCRNKQKNIDINLKIWYEIKAQNLYTQEERKC